jgi:hypothetical protein
MYCLPAMSVTTAATSAMEERLFIKQMEKAMEKYLDAQTVWERAQAHITTRMIHLFSASSIARINSVYETEYTVAYTANNPLDLFNVIVMAHTFSGQTSGAEDRRQMTLEFVSFDYSPPETLYAYRKRFDLMVLKMIFLAMPEANRTASMLAYAFYSGLARYPAFLDIRSLCIRPLASVNKPTFDTVGRPSTQNLYYWSRQLRL